MNLQIYDNSKTNLTPISFINDLPNQLKIRDIDTDSQEFRGQLGLLFTKISNLLGIKNKIDSINKKDIVDLLLMKYKSFSLEEIDYCFKLERFNSLGEKTQHFQLINSEYVSLVLDKYMNWKLNKRKTNNLQQKKNKNEMTQIDKDRFTIQAVRNQLEFFLKNRVVDSSRIYVYDVFDKIGLMPTDLSYKKSVKNDALQILKIEYENKKALTKEDYKNNKKILEQIVNRTNSDKLRLKCKELALEDFLRKEIKQESDIERLINKING